MVYFKKSQPSPNIGKNYSSSEVKKRVQEDFCSKCYICEQKNTRSVEVEHFKPHKGDSSLKYDWNNLFLACSQCNRTKGSRYHNILNCTNIEDKVDSDIEYSCEIMPKSNPIFKALKNCSRLKRQ